MGRPLLCVRLEEVGKTSTTAIKTSAATAAQAPVKTEYSPQPAPPTRLEATQAATGDAEPKQGEGKVEGVGGHRPSSVDAAPTRGEQRGGNANGKGGAAQVGAVHSRGGHHARSRHICALRQRQQLPRGSNRPRGGGGNIAPPPPAAPRKQEEAISQILAPKQTKAAAAPVTGTGAVDAPPGLPSTAGTPNFFGGPSRLAHSKRHGGPL